MHIGEAEPMAIESERAYVVYDDQTGRIVHMHKVTIFSGAAGPSPQDEEARALMLAKRFGHSSHALKVRAVTLEELDRLMRSKAVPAKGGDRSEK